MWKDMFLNCIYRFIHLKQGNIVVVVGVGVPGVRHDALDLPANGGGLAGGLPVVLQQADRHLLALEA